jgi:hypothetical protein
MQRIAQKGRRKAMQSTLSTMGLLIGIVLMAGCGSLIAGRIGVEQWQMAGFAIGILLCAIAPTWELRSRLKKLEDRPRGDVP